MRKKVSKIKVEEIIKFIPVLNIIIAKTEATRKNKGKRFTKEPPYFYIEFRTNNM